ncbi:MAG: hypothetical protein WD448_04680, partial [Woeseia sp.]
MAISQFRQSQFASILLGDSVISGEMSDCQIVSEKHEPNTPVRTEGIHLNLGCVHPWKDRAISILDFKQLRDMALNERSVL